MSVGEWLDQNWWLVAFWVLELAVLFTFLAWSRRRRSRRSRQLDSVVTGLARVLPDRLGTGARSPGAAMGRATVRFGCGSS